MGLFSSKSKSTTNLTDYSNNVESSIGDLSSNNKIVTGDYVEQGLVGENLTSLLGTVENLNKLNVDAVNNLYNSSKGAFDKMVETVQKTTETAITETGEAYAESKSELRNFIDAVRPIALYVAIASVFYFIFKRSK